MRYQPFYKMLTYLLQMSYGPVLVITRRLGSEVLKELFKNLPVYLFLCNIKYKLQINAKSKLNSILIC